MFQAKDCIDDCKEELEEWKGICAEREAELRAIYHKLYNDKVAIDKQVDFSEDIKVTNYSQERPVVPFGRVKNYVLENRNRLRSKSRLPKSGKRSSMKLQREALLTEAFVEFSD